MMTTASHSHDTFSFFLFLALSAYSALGRRPPRSSTQHSY